MQTLECRVAGQVGRFLIHHLRTLFLLPVIYLLPNSFIHAAGCDINGNGSTTVTDVQLCTNQALGILTCNTADINQDGRCDVIDVQRVINNALGGPCVTPTPPPPPPPPPSSGTYPTGWNDPRFAGVVSRSINSYGMSGTTQNFEIITNSGEPAVGCDNFTIRNFRIRGREGIRICGDNVLAEDGFLEITGSGADHADGIQAYGSNGMKNIVFRRLNIVVRGAANTGIFMADNAAVDLTLDTVRVDGTGAPNGGMFIANAPGDRGCNSLTFRNVQIIGGYRFEGIGGGGCNIIEWTNVTDGTGKAIPRP